MVVDDFAAVVAADGVTRRLRHGLGGLGSVRPATHAGRVAFDHLAPDGTLDVGAGLGDGVGGDNRGAEGHADEKEDFGGNHSCDLCDTDEKYRKKARFVKCR